MRDTATNHDRARKFLAWNPDTCREYIFRWYPWTGEIKPPERIHRVMFLIYVQLAVVALAARPPGHVHPSALPLDAKVHDNGDVSVLMNGEPYFESEGLFFRHNGALYLPRGSPIPSKASQPGQRKQLILERIQRDLKGFDAMGTYTETVIDWSLDTTRVSTGVKVYQGGWIVFSQRFPFGLNLTSTGDENQIISSFPSFRLPENNSVDSRGFVGYKGNMMGYHYRLGPWTSAADKDKGLPDGLDGTGPLIVFEPGAPQPPTVVISPKSAFMATNQVVDNSSHLLGSRSPSSYLRYGIMGRVRELPLNFQAEIILCPDLGINRAMYNWGNLLLRTYDKDRAPPKLDLSLTHMGFATDNGAWYYYQTEEGLSYQDTLMAVKEYSERVGVKYRYLQIDSWWYYQDKESWGAHGVLNWTARPDVFPNGLDFVFNATSWPYVAHNRFWSNKTDYAIQNGGQFRFCMDDKKATPIDPGFWMYLFAYAKKWGVHVYEQDWLFAQFEENHCTLDSVTTAREWLVQMGEAATAHGINIQYCMSWPRHALQSVEIQSVTQARASDDYHPGNDQWRIGVTSIFAHAIGLAPLKDTFWSNSTLRGRYGDDREIAPRLQAAVATLSTGNVSPSDKINWTNVDIVQRCVDSNGKILAPDTPAKILDQAILSGALDPGSKLGEVWASCSEISGFCFPQILNADSPPTTLSFEDVLDTFNYMYRHPGHHSIDDVNTRYHTFLAVDTAAVSLGEPPMKTLQYVSKESPLKLSATNKTDFQLWALSPVLPNEWSFLGEIADKWVPASSRRFSNLVADASGISVTASGGPGETIEVWAVFVGLHEGSDYAEDRQDFASTNGKNIAHCSCTMSNSGTVRISLPMCECLAF
ncbi:hypothetical protein AAMO2058_001239300 [Amorphochlora amoebiformis]